MLLRYLEFFHRIPGANKGVVNRTTEMVPCLTVGAGTHAQCQSRSFDFEWSNWVLNRGNRRVNLHLQFGKKRTEISWLLWSFRNMRIRSTWNCPNLYSFLVNPEPPTKVWNSKFFYQDLPTARLVWLPSEITLLDAPRQQEGSETVVKQVQQRMKPLLWRKETSNDSWFINQCDSYNCSVHIHPIHHGS